MAGRHNKKEQILQPDPKRNEAATPLFDVGSLKPAEDDSLSTDEGMDSPDFSHIEFDMPKEGIDSQFAANVSLNGRRDPARESRLLPQRETVRFSPMSRVVYQPLEVCQENEPLELSPLSSAASSNVDKDASISVGKDGTDSSVITTLKRPYVYLRSFSEPTLRCGWDRPRSRKTKVLGRKNGHSNTKIRRNNSSITLMRGSEPGSRQTSSTAYFDDSHSMLSWSMENDDDENIYSYWFTNEDQHNIWPDADLVETSVFAYRERVLTSCQTSRKLALELFLVCRHNYPKRLQVICEVIAESALKLSGDYFCDKMGASVLHLAILHNSTDVTMLLMEQGGQELILKEYNHPEYEGATALHLAVVKSNHDVIFTMLRSLSANELKVFLHRQASGSFFHNKLKASGLPLSLAAWTGNKTIFDELMHFGARLDEADKNTGNSVLHTLVEHSICEPEVAGDMIKHVLYNNTTKLWWMKKRDLAPTELSNNQLAAMHNYLLRQENFAKLTPLKISAKIASLPAFQALVQQSRVYRYPQWEYGPASYNMYEISEIDPIVHRLNYHTVLATLVNDSGDANLQFFATEPIKTLVEEKWEAYWIFFCVWASTHVGLMVCFTMYALKKMPVEMAQYMSNMTFDHCSLQGTVKYYSEDLWLLVMSILMVLYASVGLALILLQVVSGFYEYWTRPRIDGSESLLELIAIGPYKLYTITLTVLLVAWVLMRVCKNRYENGVMALCLVLGWSIVLYFTHAIRSVGLFSVMIYRTMLKVLPPFLVIFTIINVAYSCAFQCLLQSTREHGLETQEFNDFFGTFFYLIEMTVGIVGPDIVEYSKKHPVTARLALGGFILVCNIQLINMLIAAITDTYASVSGQHNNLWLKLRTNGILSIEKLLPIRCRPTSYLESRIVSQPFGEKKLYYLPVEEIGMSKHVQ